MEIVYTFRFASIYVYITEKYEDMFHKSNVIYSVLTILFIYFYRTIHTFFKLVTV